MDNILSPWCRRVDPNRAIAEFGEIRTLRSGHQTFGYLVRDGLYLTQSGLAPSAQEILQSDETLIELRYRQSFRKRVGHYLMESSDFLLAIADLAIALITFAAIVLVLRQMVGRQLSAFQLLVLKLFAICGFETIFFALLPFILNFLGLPIQILWQVSSALFFIVIIVTTIWYWRCRQEVSPGRRQNWSTISVTIVLSLAVLGLLFHALGLIYVGSIGPYAFALVSGLVPVATSFFASLDDFLSAGS